MLKEYTEISTPSLGVNDSSATVVEWMIGDKEKVNKGDVVAVLETTKSAFDVETDTSGFLVQLFKEGDEVSVGQTISIVVEDVALIDQMKDEYIAAYKNKQDKDANKITKKAKLRAKEHGVSLNDLFAKFDGIIREKDVDIFLSQRDEKDDFIEELSYIGEINLQFIDRLEKNSKFKLLTSAEKISIYRENGAIIEDGVTIGHGSVMISNYIHIMKDATIGSNCYIRSHNFNLGIMSSIGNNSNIVTKNVKIGDVCTLGSSVMITGGFGFHSTIKVGDNSLISGNCLLDAGEGIYIGKEVGISPYVKLYTHNHWQSELEGYHSNFGPIFVKDKAYITGDCLIVPGVTIGKGATILANSTVTDNVQPGNQVCGNPARVIGKVSGSMAFEKKDRIVRRIIKEMKQYFLQEKKVDPNSVMYTPDFVIDSKHNDKCILTFSAPDNLSEKDIKCTLFDLGTFNIYGKQNTTSDEVRNFLRRRGIKFKPIYWRYTGERYLYND